MKRDERREAEKKAKEVIFECVMAPCVMNPHRQSDTLIALRPLRYFS
jgi:hypothetical protein